MTDALVHRWVDINRHNYRYVEEFLLQKELGKDRDRDIDRAIYRYMHVLIHTI